MSMVLVHVATATNKQLNWMVAKCEGYAGQSPQDLKRGWGEWNPCEDWNQMGPILDRERIGVWHYQQKDWMASWWFDGSQAFGPTPLIALARCYVMIKLGKEVEVPSELV